MLIYASMPPLLVNSQEDDLRAPTCGRRLCGRVAMCFRQCVRVWGLELVMG